MLDEASDGALLELRKVGDISGSFRVARYQRGYRWGEQEVKQLLEDIWQSNGASYCLQPVVVKRDGEDAWELVDGQQRLTTLYLIFGFMQAEQLQSVGAPYSIQYDTRDESRAYLDELDAAHSGANIDFFHLYQSHETIRKWFDAHGARRQHVANKFYGYLFESVSVIWYEAGPALDSTKLFTRLNLGRIPLTDAELLKALLLSRSTVDGAPTARTHEIATQWDAIERDLRRADLWGFVADTDTADSPTHISLLLDTLAKGPHGRARPRFHTFDVLRRQIEQSGVAAVWDDVVQLHALVVGWFENRELYHKVGFLIATGERFSALVDLASGQARSAFAMVLDDRIRASLDLAASDLLALSYSSDGARCERLLLLMNVETVRRLRDSNERYPFRVHRGKAWSLEHIHAQNADSLTKVEQWEEWLRLHRNALGSLPSLDESRRQELLRRIDEVGITLDRSSFQALAREVDAAFTSAGSSPGQAAHTMHSLSNLALLDGGHNSALSNSVFEVKRQRILELDREGQYIPICTRQVFLKYYSGADAQQIHFWGVQDREAYLAAIGSRTSGIGAYLKPEHVNL